MNDSEYITIRIDISYCRGVWGGAKKNIPHNSGYIRDNYFLHD